MSGNKPDNVNIEGYAAPEAGMVPRERYNYDPQTGKPIPKEKPTFDLTNRDRLFLWLSIALSIVGVALTFWGGFKSGFTITYVLLFILLTIYFYRGKLTVYGTICGALALLSAGVYTYTADGTVNFFLLVVLFALSAVWFSSLRGYEERKTDFGLFTHVFASTFGVAFSGIGISGRSIFKKDGKKAGFIKVLIGIACAVPVVFIVVGLLTDADAAFEALIDKVGELLEKSLWQVFVGLLLAPILISYGLNMKKRERVSKPVKEKKGIGNLYILAFLGAMCLAYILYLVAQLGYFFNGFMGILPEGSTYAEYARRGFFELCVVAGINFLVIFLVLLFSRKKNQKPQLGIAVECTFIGAFTLVIIATAIAKMALYMKTYGLTVPRIICTAFMVLLAVVFIALIVRLFVTSVPVLRIGLITATVLLLILGYGNMDKVIAEHNMNLYKTGVRDTADPYEMEKLGATGVPYLIELTKDKNAEEKQNAEMCLDGLLWRWYSVVDYEKSETEYKRDNRNLGDWNYSVTPNLKLLEEYFETTKGYSFKQ